MSNNKIIRNGALEGKGLDQLSCKKFGRPAYTQIPNEILDLLPQLAGDEFKVLVFLAAKTFACLGHAEDTALNPRDLSTGTALPPASLRNAVANLLSQGLIELRGGRLGLAFEVAA